MDRDTAKGSESVEPLGTRANGRGKPPLVINRNGARNDLFSKPTAKETLLSGIRPTKASLARSASVSISPEQSPNSSDVRSPPFARTQNIKTASPKFTLKDAYRMAADAEDVGPGSPSPAPRPWRARPVTEDKKTVRSPTPGQANRVSRQAVGVARHSRNAIVVGHGAVQPAGHVINHLHRDEASDIEFDEKIEEFGRTQESDNGHGDGGRRSLFAKAFLSPDREGREKELFGEASNGNREESSPVKEYKPWAIKAAPAEGLMRRAMESPAKQTVEQNALVAQPDEPPAGATTPSKSFAFDMDADFTEGDLSVSNSPPVRTGTNIGKTRQNRKLDEIRALELQADLTYADEVPEPLEVGALKNEEEHERGPRQIARTNTKLDEIRARELDSESRRALAKARLDEIRQQNAERRSHSTLPGSPRKPKNDTVTASLAVEDKAAKPASVTIRDEAGERIPDTPVTLYRKVDIVEEPAGKDGKSMGHKAEKSTALQSKDSKPAARGDSWEALRRLARATSSSPAPEPEPEPETKQQASQSDAMGEARDKAESLDKHNESDPRLSRRDRSGNRPRMTVEFAGLERESSTDSEKSSKRSSAAISEIDPTERIERELQLFAPGENHSERGSVRAPSPYSDPEDVDETPRGARSDPPTQATPRVTGAYVETPVTVKVERVGVAAARGIMEPEKAKVDPGLPLPNRSRKPEISPRKPTKTSSAPSDGIRDTVSTRLRTAASRRARSLARSRSPLINSSRPPTVKDDLLEIQKTYQIEDSTLEDLDGFFAAQASSPPPGIARQNAKSEEGVTGGEQAAPNDLDADEKNSKAIRRIGRSLESIRTARKGIERLEDEVSRTKDMDHKEKGPQLGPSRLRPHSHDPDHVPSACPICLAHPARNDNMIAYVHFPVPRLWRRNPTFRFTVLGLLLFILTIWYAAESTMCHFYCKPKYCYPDKPCIWSYDDPFWGYAIPVKLDQWATGGAGRAMIQKARPEAADWLADVWDDITGTDIRTVDTRYYDWDQKRQHRRRLMKRGMIKPLVVDNPEDKAKYDAWAKAREARERADAMREMGYDVHGEEETMSADERL